MSTLVATPLISQAAPTRNSGNNWARLSSEQDTFYLPLVRESMNSLIATLSSSTMPAPAANSFWNWISTNSREVAAEERVTPIVETVDTPVSDAVDSIKTILGIKDADVATLLDVSRRTLTNWRNGQAAYDSSTRRLRTVRTLITHLQSALGGDEELRLWFEMDSGIGISRLRTLSAGDDGYFMVLAQAEPILFGSSAARDADFGDLGEGDISAAILQMSSGASKYEPRPLRRVRSR